MIHSFIHVGSGLGNQLHRLIAGKVLALDNGFEYSAIGREYFKGKDFMSPDFGRENNIVCKIDYPEGRIVPLYKTVWEEKTSYYNPEYHFLRDGTIIDGEFQSNQYWGHRMKEIDEWLKVEPLGVRDDVCVIGFRGGEFYLFPELGLPLSYFEQGIDMMKKINPSMRFEVHTDDKKLAQEFFPSYEVIQDIGINWRTMRYAKHAIIANSSFYILPRLLSGGVTIAPRFWARRNIQEWSRPDNYYSQFQYV